MSRHRFFLEEPLPVPHGADVVLLPLSGQDLHHAVAVLRVRAGEEIDVVEPGGSVWRFCVTAAGQDALIGRVAEELVAANDSAPRVTLVFGVSKGSKNDDIVEGAVEVGVAAIMPVLTARSVVKLDAEKRVERGERWRRVALAAAKQSKRSCIPDVIDPGGLSDTIAGLEGFELVLVAWEESAADAAGVREAVEAAAPLPDRARVALVVGPEGGLAAEEAAAFERAGGVLVTLGPTILRAETAAVVASALLIHELGGLGNRR